MNRRREGASRVCCRVSVVVAMLILTAWVRGQAAEENGLHWYKCNTHTHTASFPNSDANLSAEYAVRWYKQHGYQCVVITDHEHLTPVDSLNEEFGGDSQFLVIRGQEITQGIQDSSKRIRWSHVNGININRAIMPIGYPDYPTTISMADTYARNIDEVYAAGGMPQINHPTPVMGPHLEDLLPISRPVLFEVWNAFPSLGPLGGEDEQGNKIPSFESLWDSLLSHGKTAWGVASDDVHDYLNFDDPRAPTPGKAWIVVRARQLKLEDVMDAIRNGHFYASTGVALKDYRVDESGISITIDPPFAWKSAKEKAEVFYRTRFIGKDGKVLAEMAGLSPQYKFKGDESYVRTSIIDSDGHRAWTQPVFRDERKH